MKFKKFYSLIFLLFFGVAFVTASQGTILTDSLSDDAAEGTLETSNEESDEVTESYKSIQPATSDTNPLHKSRTWQVPTYDKQTSPIGYTPDTFKVPDDLKERVQFWTDIYTKYSTSQGLLHDSLHIDLVYEILDFKDLESDTTLTPMQIEREKKKRIKERKKYLSELFKRFEKLETLETPEGLTEFERSLWDKFSKIDEKDKFKNAGKRGRLRIQMGLRERFIDAIFYSGRYLQDMEKIFAEMNLPLELTRLPFVESSFNLNARSKSGASGIWQIMPYTGRRMMKVGYAIDDRNEPIRATKAAAKLLKFNYDELQDWPLAVTAYNYGVAGMKRIVKKAQSENLADFVGKRPARRFGFASSSFYASFLAALYVEKEAPKYFGEVKWSAPIQYSEVITEKNFYFKNILPFFNGDSEYASEMNPHLTRRVEKNLFAIPKGTYLRFPESKKDEFVTFMQTAKEIERPVIDGQEYLIAQGDTLSDIAKMYQVPLNKILEANDHLDPRRLRPGMKVTIPK